MKLAAVTFGTEGDTRPIATLCGALRDAGHDVDAHSLKPAIAAAETTEIRHRATALGEKMHVEGGLASAVAVIESVVNPHVDGVT